MLSDDELWSFAHILDHNKSLSKIYNLLEK